MGLQPRKSHGPHPSKATPTLKATQKHGSFHDFRSFSKKEGKWNCHRCRILYYSPVDARRCERQSDTVTQSEKYSGDISGNRDNEQRIRNDLSSRPLSDCMGRLFPAVAANQPSERSHFGQSVSERARVVLHCSGGPALTSKFTTIVTVGFSGSVSSNQNPAAHGAVCHLQARKTADGIVGRKVNSNGRHSETSKVFRLDADTLAQWQRIDRCSR